MVKYSHVNISGRTVLFFTSGIILGCSLSGTVTVDSLILTLGTRQRWRMKGSGDSLKMYLQARSTAGIATSGNLVRVDIANFHSYSFIYFFCVLLSHLQFCWFNSCVYCVLICCFGHAELPNICWWYHGYHSVARP